MKNLKITVILSIALIFGFQLDIIAQSEDGKEMRAVWIATVKNIDWPSSKNLSTERQKAEIIRFLDLFNSLAASVF